MQGPPPVSARVACVTPSGSWLAGWATEFLGRDGPPRNAPRIQATCLAAICLCRRAFMELCSPQPLGGNQLASPVARTSSLYDCFQDGSDPTPARVRDALRGCIAYLPWNGPTSAS